MRSRAQQTAQILVLSAGQKRFAGRLLQRGHNGMRDRLQVRSDRWQGAVVALLWGIGVLGTSPQSHEASKIHKEFLCVT